MRKPKRQGSCESSDTEKLSNCIEIRADEKNRKLGIGQDDITVMAMASDE